MIPVAAPAGAVRTGVAVVGAFARTGVNLTKSNASTEETLKWGLVDLTMSYGGFGLPRGGRAPVAPVARARMAPTLFQEFGVNPGENLALDTVSGANGRSYLTYALHDNNAVVYVGRTAGFGTPSEVLFQRLMKGHDYFQPGMTARILDVQASLSASQGAEEFFIQGYRELGASLRNANEALSFGTAARTQNSLTKMNGFFNDLFDRK